MVRNKDKSCNTYSYSFLFLRFIFTSSSLTPLLSPSAKIYNYLITLLCWFFFLMLFPWFSIGLSSSQTASAWVLCIQFRPPGMYCSSMGPFWASVPARNPAPSRTPLHRLQLLPDNLHQHVLSMVPSSHKYLLQQESSLGCRGRTWCIFYAVCSSTWSASFPSLFTDLADHRMHFSHFYLSQILCSTYYSV